MPAYLKIEGVKGESANAEPSDDEFRWTTEEGTKGTAAGMDDLAIQGDVSPIGLLLPAVQQAREAARPAKDGHETPSDLLEYQGADHNSGHADALDSFNFNFGKVPGTAGDGGSDERDLLDADSSAPQALDALLIINRLNTSAQAGFDDIDLVSIVTDTAAEPADFLF